MVKYCIIKSGIQYRGSGGMCKFETQLKKLKHEVLTEVARLAKNDEISLESIEKVPYEVIKGDVAQYRCCVYKERAIVLERAKLAAGYLANGDNPEPDLIDIRPDEQIIYVIEAACDRCPIERCINALKAERDYDEVIFTTPDGEQFNQPMANSLSLAQNLIILCGHFKGIDYRIREHLITKEISIGDYVLTGGELAAAVMADAIVRIIPGVISDEQSALSDSFQDNLLAAPVYTRPADYKGWKVPDILLSGHEAKIKEWELQQSLERTKKLRPDLLED